MASNTTYTGNYTFGENGVIVPDTADILQTVQNEFVNALGQDLSLEEATPQGRLIDVETTARRATINFNAQIANILINIQMSAGAALDAWGANFNIQRNGATPSTVPVTVTGVPDTVIPAGAQAATSQGIIWTNESEIIIGDDGTAQGTFICSRTGAVELGIGELTTIVASSTLGINGWETITNTAAATLGTDRKSDTSYKLRILESIFSGSAVFGNYASAVNKVENVNDVYVQENPYGADLPLDNITIPAHSIFVCVDGGNTEDVAYALYEVKSAGCGWCGNTTVTVIDKEFETTNTVMFYVPSASGIKFYLNITALNNSSADLESLIQNTIINYFSGSYADENYKKPGIRGLISPFTIASLLNSQITGININQVEVGLVNPIPHAIPSILKASITSGITWATVNTYTFSTKVSNINGTYNFIFDGSNWQLNSSTVVLTEYGLTITGTPITGDTVSVLFSNGEMSQSPIMLFATEVPSISADNITVTING